MDSLNISEAIFSKAITTENGTLRLAVLTVLVGAAGALIAYGLWRKNKSRRRVGRVLKRSTSLALLHGGDMALQRLVEYHEARVDAHKLDQAELDLKAWIHDERPDFRELARISAKLEMSGKEDIAIRMLKEEFQKARKDKKIHEAYEFEMLLVEMLIFKGEFEKALRHHECLKAQNISDARAPLYKAIIFLGKSDRKKAKEVWHEFLELKTSFSCQPEMQKSMEQTGIYKLCSSFEEFEMIVNKLKADIKSAKKIIHKD